MPFFPPPAWPGQRLLPISGEYLLRLAMTPSSQELESPENPGRFIITLDALLESDLLGTAAELRTSLHLYL